MVEECLDLNLERLSTLQRRLLLEFLRERYPQYWGRLKSHFYSWRDQRAIIEEFIRGHLGEVFRLLSGEGLLKSFGGV